MIVAGAKRIRRLEGQIVEIRLGEDARSFGCVLQEPLFQFYNKSFHNEEYPDLTEITALPVVFKIWVMNYAVSKGIWPVVGRVSLKETDRVVPLFFKKDPIDGKLSIYKSDVKTGSAHEYAATASEVEGLERAAVWDPEHVVDRLRDHFLGRKNKWVSILNG